MAAQLNRMLPARSLKARDVAIKVGNLVTQYRRKKEEQEEKNPRIWRYHDLIDELLGEC